MNAVVAKDGGSVRDRLLRAADDLFYREGVHTVGIDRILERAGVAKASLYGTFGSKDELIRAYLDERGRWLRERIDERLARSDDPRARLLAVFEELADRVSEGVYHGCPFVRASAEGPPGPNAPREAAATFRSWRRRLFESLARELGVRDADTTSKQLAMIYDGAAIAVSMDRDPSAALAAKDLVERLLERDPVAARAKAKRAARTRTRRAQSTK